MNKNANLLQLIKARKGSGEFGYGITTADRYVQDAIEAVGNGMALKYFRCIGQSGGAEGLIKRAAGTLTICSPETVSEKQVSSIAEMAKILGCAPPPHSMLAMVNKLTTPREDRDGDTLQTIGGNMDPKSPMLWQHIHTLPIGRMMRVIDQTKDVMRVASVLLDINELTSDAAKLFEAGALRFSHGFIAKEFEERKGSSASGGVPRFNITKFDIVEESAVSVPSNVDAEVELFCRGKLASDVFKSHAKSLFDKRNKSMPVTSKAKEAISPKQGLPQPKQSDEKASKSIIRKMFDIATQRVEPSTMEYDWAARFIGCSVKDLHVHTTAVGGMLIGAFLKGLDIVCQRYKCQDTRNLNHETEQPPVFETREITSDSKQTFLIEGLRFWSNSEAKIVTRTWQGWGSQALCVYAETGEKAQEIIDETWDWVQKNNPLKGQAFALTGGWIEKSGTAWGDVFLEPAIENALKRTVRIINEKGINAANRGLILSGPPGTGKTLSARVMLNEAKSTFIWVSPKDFYQGGGFMEAFSLARSLAPSILMFEDIDNWIDRYSVDLMKAEMDGLQQCSGVTTILTTNFPDQLPAALIDRPGRFHDVLEIHLPTRDARLRMLSKWASGATLESLSKMAEGTDGYSGAHIYELCHFAKVIKDEDECSLEDALTKAFDKVKDQRDLINQNQLAGSSYRPGRRELTAMQAKGWAGKTALNTKLDDSLSMIGPHPAAGEDQSTFMDRCMLDPTMIDDYPTESNRQAACKLQWNKSAKQGTGFEFGFVLKDMGKCKDCSAKGDLDADGYCAECAKKEKEEGSEPKSGSVLRDAIMLASTDRTIRAKLKAAIEAFDQADKNEQLAEEFRKLERSLSPG